MQQTHPNIRPVTAQDLPAVKAVIDATEMFPSEMLDDMIADYLNTEESHDIWFTYDEGGAISVAYCAPERMTEGTWNLYLIAVHPDYQGGGRGAAMMQYIEQLLADRGQRVLLVETSGLPEFERTRAFYHQCQYDEEARIREFYQAGEDKIVFRKAL